MRSLYNIVYNMYRKLIPSDFKDKLPALKEQSFVWSLDYNTKTNLRPTGHIKHFSTTDNPRGNLILVPGLASNTATEPLMKSITYWGLVSRYDVYCMDSFLGDFNPTISIEDAKRNTYDEFVRLIDTGLNIVQKQCFGQYSCLITHSAGCSALIDIFNSRIEQGKKLRFSSSVMFAPFTPIETLEWFKNLYKARYKLNNISDEEFYKTPMGITSPHTPNGGYVSIMPKFYDDSRSDRFRPDLMNEWGTPVTLVGAGKDKKAPMQIISQRYDILRKQSNGHLFRLVEFPTSKHSFIDQHKDWSAIINLIKSQRIPADKRR